ncbi:MAG: DinB family protein [Cyclobacteriaceae bacterium]|nr:DinB family protein [Cyclobacteriaceae bacterium]
MTHWNHKIQKTTASIMTEFGKLSEEDLNWKPGPDRWSIAQVMDHVMTTNESYFPIFDQIKEDTYTTPLMGRIPFITSMMGKMILKYVNPGMKKKTKTFRPWEPAQSRISADITGRFQQHQQDLMVRINSLEKYLDRKYIISSPINRNIVYSLDDAIEIIVAHEERHLNQAREVLEARKLSE